MKENVKNGLPTRRVGPISPLSSSSAQNRLRESKQIRFGLIRVSYKECRQVPKTFDSKASDAIVLETGGILGRNIRGNSAPQGLKNYQFKIDLGIPLSVGGCSRKQLEVISENPLRLRQPKTATNPIAYVKYDHSKRAMRKDIRKAKDIFELYPGDCLVMDNFQHVEKKVPQHVFRVFRVNIEEGSGSAESNSTGNGNTAEDSIEIVEESADTKGDESKQVAEAEEGEEPVLDKASESSSLQSEEGPTVDRPIIGEHFRVKFNGEIEYLNGKSVDSWWPAAVLKVKRKGMKYSVTFKFNDKEEKTYDYPNKDVQRLDSKSDARFIYVDHAKGGTEDGDEKEVAVDRNPKAEDLSVGDLVDGFFQNGSEDGRWYRGRIAFISERLNTVSLRYDDGEVSVCLCLTKWMHWLLSSP